MPPAHQNPSKVRHRIFLRVLIVALILTGFAITVLASVIHVVLQNKPLTLAKPHIDTLTPPRGNIYSENGMLMVTSLPAWNAYFDPFADGLPPETLWTQLPNLAKCLANTLNTRSTTQWLDYLLQKIRTGNRYIHIASSIDLITMKQLKTCPIFRRGRYRGGLILENHIRRHYVFGELARRTLGYAYTTYQSGLERYFHQILAGNPGLQIAYKLPRGNQLIKNILQKPQPGNDLIVTLDPFIQDIAHHHLLQMLIQTRADHGCVIVMEVPTGKLRAIVNLKCLPNGQCKEYHRNYAIHERYEPGSTWKAASILAVLEATNLSTTSPIPTFNGKFKYYDRLMEDHELPQQDTVPLRKAFAHSMNVALSHLVWETFRDQPHQFINYLRQFGLTEPTGITFPNEPTPRIKTPDDPTWSGTTLPWMAIGYEVQVTPLQLLTFYNAIANNGTLIKPLLVSEIRQGNHTIERFTTQILRKQIASPNAIHKLQTLLQAVVHEGTAKNIYSPYLPIAGKTGTAQIARKGKYLRQYVSSFVGYFPADQPLFSCIVVIHNPKHGFYGSQVAAPVFYEIARRLLAKYTTINPSTIIPPQPPHTWQHAFPTSLAILFPEFLPTTTTTTNHTLLTFQDTTPHLTTPHPDTIPDVRNMALSDALALLSSYGLQIHIKGSPWGRISHQYPPPGKPRFRYRTITLWLQP